MTVNPIKITDTTFRDAHQSLMATRLRIEDMEPIAAQMDEAGFHSAEVWGGATFDATTRFLAEDPWERLRTFKNLMPKTPLMMLLRGQSLVGYRTYADDVVESFVDRSGDNGIDIFRVFDALNYVPNLEVAAKAVKKNGKHLQMAICYTVTEEGRLGGSIYNLDYFVSKARDFLELGADSICLKDMGGLMAPYDAVELVTALKEFLPVPLQLHLHYTSGMASMTALKAIESGVDVIDTALSPLALRTSQPAVEPLIVALRNSDRATGLDLDKMLEMGDYLESMLPKYKAELETPRAAVIDAKVLRHQIPGGMSSNLVSQLREADALDKLDDVLKEIPRTRADLGFPPLVTPMSQMVGSQSVSNVLFGRYTMISEPVKEYFRGNFGTPPSAVDEDLKAKIVEQDGGNEREAPVRPGAILDPEMDSAREAVNDITSNIDDVLIYALYPQTGLRFLKIKHGIEPVPDEMKPKTDDDQPSTSPPHTPPTDMSANARRFNVHVQGQRFEVVVDPVDGANVVTLSSRIPASVSPTPPAAASVPSGSLVKGDAAALLSPMPGMLVSIAVEIGQTVSAGETVLILEAMKMQNSLPAPIAGTVKELPVAPGAQVAKDDVLAIIAP